MNAAEFSDQFDVLYNNITSNQAPGLTEYEKSVFLTKAQNEIVKNYFTANSKGNNIGQGFDDSAKRQADFSCIMKTYSCNPMSAGAGGGALSYTWIATNSDPQIIGGLSFKEANDSTPYDISAGSYAVSESSGTQTINSGDVVVTGLPAGETGTLIVASSGSGSASSQIDSRSSLYSFPPDVFISVNETIVSSKGINLQVVPLRYDEYLRLMSKPYKRPLKYQAWRLINTGEYDGSVSNKFVEIIVGPGDSVSSYMIRYIRFPKPIIVGDLDGLTIDNYKYNGQVDPAAATETSGCELDPILHPDILQRAVELAKVAWTQTGGDNTQAVIQTGQRSE